MFINYNTLYYIIFSITAVFLLSGCESVKNSLGLNHYQADEFDVPENQPLTIPDDLQIKSPEAIQKQNKDKKTDAKDILLGTTK